MIEFITGASGSGKTTLMLSRIKQKAENGGKQCVIVPEQYSYEFDKTLYFHIGAERFNELVSLSFTGLARLIFQLYGEPDRNGEYADELARMIIIYQAISAAQKNPDALKFFRRQSSQNGFAEEVLELISEMKRSGITPDILMSKSVFFEDDGKLRDKTADIAAVYFEYERLMQEYSFKDNLENIREAAKTANLNRYFEGYNVYLDEFESFTGDQLEMIKVIISSAKNVYITLRTDNVNAGKYTLFETVNNTYHAIEGICRELHKETKITECRDSYRFRSTDLEYLSSRVLRNLAYQPESAPEPENIEIFEARDAYTETEYVCASIKRLIYSENKDSPDKYRLRYSDIAIISNNITEYSDVLKAAFERYDIPYFLSIEKSVAHTSVMVFFTSLLDLLTAKKIKSEQVFRLIKCGILSVSFEEASILENYCYKWGVEDKVWKEEFTADDENIELIENMRKMITEPVENLRRRLFRKNITAVEICTLLYDYLVECEAEKNLGRIMARLINQGRYHEAEELKRIWGCLMDILDSIASTLGEKEISFTEVSKIIRSMTAKIEYSAPPQTLDAVTVASARTARLNAPKVIFVICATEGDFPNTISTHGLFSEANKNRLRESNIEIDRPLSELIAAERLVVYKALSSASEKLFITYPRSDLSGKSKYPAPITEQIKNMFFTRRQIENSQTGSLLRTDSQLSPDYYAVTEHSAFYHYMQDIKQNSSSTASIKKILDSGAYRERIERIIKKSEYSNDYVITRKIMNELHKFHPLTISPSGFEKYTKCHFMYFCEKCLKLEKSRPADLDFIHIGNIAHKCLCEIVRKKEKFISMTKNDIRDEIKKCADEYIEEELGGEDFGKTPKFRFLLNKLTEHLTEALEYIRESLENSEFVPDGFEFLINPEHGKVFTIPFGDGDELMFVGIVDRADTCTVNGEKYLRIIDYKSSHKYIKPEELAAGLNMQMLIYIFVLTESGGKYDGYKPAGVLYSPFLLNDSGDADPERKTTKDEKHFKSYGMFLKDKDVVKAMEKDGKGRFISPRITNDGLFDSTRSGGCISSESIEKLRKYTYDKIIDMSQSLSEGKAEPFPLVTKGRCVCDYCDYCDICISSEIIEKREVSSEELGKVKELLEQQEDNEK